MTSALGDPYLGFMAQAQLAEPLPQSDVPPPLIPPAPLAFPPPTLRLEPFVPLSISSGNARYTTVSMTVESAQDIAMIEISPGVRAARFSGEIRKDDKGRLMLVPDGHLPEGGSLTVEDLEGIERRRQLARTEDVPLVFGQPTAERVVSALKWRKIDATVRVGPTPGLAPDVRAVVDLPGENERIELWPNETKIFVKLEETYLIIKEAVHEQLVEI